MCFLGGNFTFPSSFACLSRIKCKCGLIDFGVKEVRICFCIKIVIFCKKNTKTRDLDALEVTVFVK